MEQNYLPTEIILSHSRKVLDRLYLEENPQPGSQIHLAGMTYTVLERRHRYQLCCGRYHLHYIALYVQATQFPQEQTWMDGDWVLGDATCQFNARSPLIRCAIRPSGPCEACPSYSPL